VFSDDTISTKIAEICPISCPLLENHSTWCTADALLTLSLCMGLCVWGGGREETGAKKVVGLELCGDAVKDAKLNATANTVSNCSFEVGRAEDTIPKVCAAHLSSAAAAAAERSGSAAGADGDEGDGKAGGVDSLDKEAFGSCVAVLDPPREGVHWKVIRALRAAPEIERIVYVSCNHAAWVEQARALCCPGDGEGGRTPGEPFRPVKANGVDLFPHTSHVELVVLFERGECLKRSLAARAHVPP